MVRPGTTSLNYLHGKRKKLQKPVSFFFIWIGLYILVHNIIVTHYHYQLSEINFIVLDLRQRANILLRSHFLIFIIPIIAVSAIVIYTLLARPLFNFIEILTISTYGGGNYFMILFFSDIVLGAIFKINIVTNGVFIGQTILSAVYNFWFSFDIFTRVHIHFLWLRLICVAILVPLIGWGMMELLPAAWISLTKWITRIGRNIPGEIIYEIIEYVHSR